MYFMVIGLVQQILLTRVLGTSGYGGLSTALSVSAVVYNPVVQSSIQGVSRTVARADDAERPQITRRVLTIHAAFALPIALLFGILAGPIVQWVHAPHLVVPVRILAAVLFFYGLYAPLVGVLNGQRRFVWQAGFDMAFATLRTALMLGGAYAFSRAAQQGVLGASSGFALATAVIFVAALLIAGTGRKGAAALPLRQYLGFIGSDSAQSAATSRHHGAALLRGIRSAPHRAVSGGSRPAGGSLPRNATVLLLAIPAAAERHVRAVSTFGARAARRQYEGRSAVRDDWRAAGSDRRGRDGFRYLGSFWSATALGVPG
jgi:O-antigen/teichoic acid export membrane protein